MSCASSTKIEPDSRGLVPAIHVLSIDEKDVDARHKAGHDERKACDQPKTYSAARLAALANFFSTRSRFSFDR
jgi:hypothetical protein